MKLTVTVEPQDHRYPYKGAVRMDEELLFEEIGTDEGDLMLELVCWAANKLLFAASHA